MGDFIKLSSPALKQDEKDSSSRCYWEIPVLFEDGDLLAIDKPSNLLAVQNFSTVEAPNIQDLFRRDIERKAPWTQQRENLSTLECIYPLDADTSGVLLFAKNKPAQEFLSNLLGSEKPFRLYHALVHGVPREKDFLLNAGLLPHPLKPGLMKVDVKRGKKSLTHFKCIESFNNHAFLECQPVTERFLQIRAHLRYIKCPAIADSLYYGRPLMLSSLKHKYHPSSKHEERPLMNRAALHCSRVEIPHPTTGETLVIEAPLPKDFRASLRMLRMYGARRWEH